MATIEVGKKSISALLEEMAQTGFQGKKLGEVANIWVEMARQKDLTVFLGLTGSLSTTGQWKIIRWLIEKRYVDVLVSTGANISEDILEALGYHYYQGTWLADDEELLKLKIDRFYDVYADEMQYRKLENTIYKFASTLDEGTTYSTREFLYQFGEYLSKKGIDSIVAAAYESKGSGLLAGTHRQRLRSRPEPSQEAEGEADQAGPDQGHGGAGADSREGQADGGRLPWRRRAQGHDPAVHDNQVAREGRGGGDPPRIRHPDHG